MHSADGRYLAAGVQLSGYLVIESMLWSIATPGNEGMLIRLSAYLGFCAFASGYVFCEALFVLNRI